MPKPRSKKRRTVQENIECEIETQVSPPDIVELPKVVIDTCVFISAKISKSSTSSPVQILEKWREGHFTLIISPELLEELIYKLSERTQCTRKDLEDFVREILLNSLVLEGGWTTHCFDSVDPEDNILAAATYQGNAHYLVSTDNAVLNKKVFQNTLIINPNKFLIELGNLKNKNTQVENLDLVNINRNIKFKVEVEV